MDSCLLAHKRWDEQQGAVNCATMGGTMAVNLMEAEAAQHKHLHLVEQHLQHRVRPLPQRAVAVAEAVADNSE